MSNRWIKRPIFAILLLGSALLVCAALMVAPAHSKPSSAISVSISQSGTTAAQGSRVFGSGEVVELETTINCVIAGEYRVEFRLMGGATLISGSLASTIECVPTASVKIPLTVQVSQGGKGAVKVMVNSARAAKGRNISARAMFRFSGIEKPSAASEKAPEIKYDDKGRKILEHRL